MNIIFKKIENNLAKQYKSYLQLFIYFKKASFKNIISAPVIWVIFIPTLFLDLMVTLYQAICFPIYGIPKVKHAEYITFDRQHLKYLNFIEKINCSYCSYFIGVLAYVQEIAARTEQYWCPIKHARQFNRQHTRYVKFMDYDDAKTYKQNKEKVRRNFDDLSQ
jgi:hypothetical protein